MNAHDMDSWADKMLDDYIDGQNCDSYCRHCDAGYMRDDLYECEDCGELFCRDCMEYDLDVCKKCGEKRSEEES